MSTGVTQRNLIVESALKEYIKKFEKIPGIKRAEVNKKFQAKLYGVGQEKIFSNPQRELKAAGIKLSEIFDLEKYHSQNIKGKGIKIAIFDSGLSEVFSKDNDYSDSDFL